MRTWLRRGIPAALLAGSVLTLAAGTASAASTPLGDPTGLLPTVGKVAKIVEQKGLPPLPGTTDIHLPTMPIGQHQRALPVPGLGDGLSLSNLHLNGGDLSKLTGLPAAGQPRDLPTLSDGLSLSNIQFNDQKLPKPALGQLAGGQRSLDPSKIAISGVPTQDLPVVPNMPIDLLPQVGDTGRSLPDLTAAGPVDTSLVQHLVHPDLSHLPLTTVDQQRSLPGLGLSHLHGVTELLGIAGEEHVHTLPAHTDGRSLVPTSGDLAVANALLGKLGHTPRLPVSGLLPA
ncbi:hypothetical protein GCM10010174_23130 [Kutzneria viridogrisea]|uniref:Secreted protein n=2 Tax=Kutzneria TaxID=43356 RepID=A0ABR6BWD3_9PSEU|nr:hypothetical protein [Kutzneria albida]AHH93777.1 putative secreted protein [Kutzneria albida DSM 43870]MBA8931219.1 hypothetical protein [Kutzneria viridogrisea]